MFLTFGHILKFVLQGNLHMSVLASLAGAVVWMAELPIKLNPVIQPLMAAIKREQVREKHV
jgi:TATA-binding protein-associated factor